MTEKTILLVEDNECDVFLTRRALAKLNIPHQLIVAKDGVEALDYLFGNQSVSQNARPESGYSVTGFEITQNRRPPNPQTDPL